jgi:hypothetical protein
MDDCVTALHGPPNGLPVQHIALNECHMGVLVQPGRRQGVASEGVKDHDFVVIGQAFRQVGADEARPPSKQKPTTRDACGWCRTIVSHGQPSSTS